MEIQYPVASTVPRTSKRGAFGSDKDAQLQCQMLQLKRGWLKMQ